MQRRRFVLDLDHTALLSTSRIGSAEPQPHVVFLNPVEPVERGTGPYWRMVTQFMQPAARSLGSPGPYDFRLARLVGPGDV